MSSDFPHAVKRHGRRREPAAPSSLSSMLPIAVLLLGYAGLLGYGVWTTRLPPIALGVLLLISLLAFAVYGFDKSAAQAGRWRTAESTLHLLSLAGGWPGAWCAQRLFRHKSRKASFMAVYWATVLLNMAAVAAWVGKLLPASLLAG
ncbi:DUF1294 domain-containing protein [Variovorax paradoxus]|uniref:DUF1294 domain-containing protein n=1 Tax=Variovorax paradoxus TaxID=34073 RepID=UPI003ECD552C